MQIEKEYLRKILIRCESDTLYAISSFSEKPTWSKVWKNAKRYPKNVKYKGLPNKYIYHPLVKFTNFLFLREGTWKKY